MVRARKRFGQHFLEPAWVTKLVAAIAPQSTDRFIEIGPGRGAITAPLAAQAGRLIAIGDVHGDLGATRAALRLGGAIDGDDRWIGAGLTVVQTGDQLDRGDEERQIVDLFSRLAKDAAKSGGRVVALNGNHEIMNVQGDFR